MFAILAAVRAIGVVVSAEILTKTRESRALLLLVGWGLYALGPAIRALGPDSRWTSGPHAALSLVGSAVLVAAAFAYFTRVDASRILWLAGSSTVVLVGVLGFLPSMAILTPVAQIAMIIGASSFGVVHRRAFVEKAGSSFYWLLGILGAGAVHAVGFLTLYPRFPHAATGVGIVYSAIGVVFFVHLQTSVVEKELIRGRARELTFFDAVGDAIYVIDLDGNILQANAIAQERYAGPTGEVVGRNIREINAPEHAKSVTRRVELTREHGQLVFETHHVTAAGDWIPVEVHSRLSETDGESVIISIARDVTERVKAEAELEAHREQLEALVAERTRQLETVNEQLVQLNEALKSANEAKSQFVASMSHELRTPLNSIIGFSGILLQGLAGDLNAEQRKQLEMVNASGRHLLTLINDVLDLARVESGREVPNVERFELQAFVTQACETVEPLVAAKNVSLTARMPEEPIEMLTDSRKLRQILLNLLGNASKFTESGEIEVSAVRRGASMVEIGVRDTGTGIPADMLSRIFDEFVQLRSEGDVKPVGTGLGLAVSSKLANFLGGTILVESTPGVGSVFTVRVPISMPEDWAEATPDTGT